MISMKLTARHHFNVEPARVHAMVTDREFLSTVCERMGTRAHDVEASVGPGGTATTRTTATIDAPSVVRRFVGETLTVVQELAWGVAAPDGRREGRLSLTVPGMPVTMAGAAVAAPDAAGTSVAYDCDLRIGVPLLGAMIESQAAPEILAVLDAQQRIGDEWLAARP